MEDYLRELATASFDPALILPLFIQMVLSLYIGHQMVYYDSSFSKNQIGLYHYDVKLLNFFLTKEPSICILFLFLLFLQLLIVTILLLFPPFPSLICYLKTRFFLSNWRTLEQLCMVDLIRTLSLLLLDKYIPLLFLFFLQFTTLENTPIDYFLEGTQNKIDSNHDRWCLGLALLHLLTGHVPYLLMSSTILGQI